MSAVDENVELNGNNRVGNFICGVVEGFYGRPWSPDQRKDLFTKMNKFGMNGYLYAPKDDCKHRAYWRELYSVEEAEHLTSLIQNAKENGVTFYYALSPGLDITYSSAKELTYLKRKLEQVSQFGCNAFALLFDDIEPDMCEADKEIFQSFAHAQVSVTNEVYQHLGQPKFLFCPTEYCSTRAVPSVPQSEYLNTIGSKLLPGIDIMWTGQKVITKHITVASIKELTDVLKRPPVIWDNLHANDYDQKRVFLGPFSGRSPDLIPHLRGVLSNPNCEYEANFIAIHTLGHWSQCSVDGNRDLTNDSISADIKLETEGESGSIEDIPSRISASTYHPKQALCAAINDWLREFSRPKCAYGKVIKPQVQVPQGALLPTINTCITITTPTTTTTSSLSQPLVEVTTVCQTAFQPSSNLIMNSLLSSTGEATDTSKAGEPMDCISTPGSSPPQELIDNSVLDNRQLSSLPINDIKDSSNCIEDDGMQLDGTDGDRISSKKDEPLSYDDLTLLVDLFYLPFEHGPKGLHFLQEFNWLKSNVPQDLNSRKAWLESTNEEDVQEWNARACKFDEMTQAVSRLYNKLVMVKNRSLLCDLYPYIWDMKGVINLLNSYVKWLALGRAPQNHGTCIQGTYTWFSNGWKEAFTSGEQEPWVFRGGLTAELQRLLPLENVTDLFVWKPPDTPTIKSFVIRPYINSDQDSVYNLCLRTCDDGLDGTEVFPAHPHLIGDKLIGGYLNLSPDFCFVVADDHGVCAYALAALDAQQFYKKCETNWLPELQRKYPSPQKVAPEMITPADEMIGGIHSSKSELPEAVYKNHPSIIRMSAVSNLEESVLKQLLACVLSSLKSNGSYGVYCEVNASDKNLIEFYKKIGFIDVTSANESQEDLVFLGRTF